MAGDTEAMLDSYNVIRVHHSPNTEETFEQAEVAPTRSHKSVPLTLVAPSGSREGETRTKEIKA